MNFTKISIAAAGLLAMGTLTACQSTNTHKDSDRPQKMQQGGKHDRKASPEQREHMKQMREGMKQMKAACDGKAAGTTTQISMGDQTIDGTCTLVFKADHKDSKDTRSEFKPMKGDHKPMQGDMRMRGSMGMNPNEPLTDEKRIELTQQFNQRLADMQARQKAIAQACQGQKAGTTVQLKAGEQTINGKCKVRFQPNKPMMPMPASQKAA